MAQFRLIFDKIILKQLRKSAKSPNVKTILVKMLDKIEDLGPECGKLIDSRLFLYELKNKHPPIRLYFKYNKITNEIYIFEFEIKSSEKKQQSTIEKIKRKFLKF